MTRSRTKSAATRTPDDQCREILGWLAKTGTRAGRDAMARYNIPSTTAFGVGVGVLQKKAKECGRSHALAAELWKTGRYEARMMACYIDEPSQLTVAQMDRWAQDFDNWGICDTACFVLFDKSPLAWGRVKAWSTKRETFVKRAGLALLWGLTVHDKKAPDASFLGALPLVERAADDDRDLVRKGASMALRATGKRNPALRAAALEVAERLTKSLDAGASRIGREAVRELSSKKVRG